MTIQQIGVILIVAGILGLGLSMIGLAIVLSGRRDA